ncbi:MAG: SpoIIE family protein phosphatase [Cyanobacteria bacterium NC_groundwater_1444_Ag_S-0.65um_54_12]|nr:SpoIIE family protein phosphatase [Cyanobacteria bacterium NC_groundwater_1444_Ag_S-0.65um_54_12]
MIVALALIWLTKLLRKIIRDRLALTKLRPSRLLREFAQAATTTHSAPLLCQAFCKLAKEIAGTSEFTVYLRSAQRLIRSAVTDPTDNQSSDLSLPAELGLPESQKAQTAYFISHVTFAEHPDANNQEWILLQSGGNVLGVVALSAKRKSLWRNAEQRSLLLLLCQELASALAALAIFTELAEVENLAHELELSREVQSILLSRSLPLMRGIQLAAKSLPVTDGGGDFFDVMEIEDGRLGLLIGDVGTRGMAGAFLIAMTLAFFRSLIPGASSARQVLEAINALLQRYRSVAETGIAICYGICDIRARTLTIACAGMPPPILNGQLLKLAGVSLGSRDVPLIHEEKVPLTSGDVLVLLSEGWNAVNRQGETLGWERLRHMVGDYMALSAEQLVEQLLQQTLDWSSGTPPIERTVLCLKVNAIGAR